MLGTMTRDGRYIVRLAGILATVNDEEHDGEELSYLTSRTTFVRLPEMISDNLSLHARSAACFSESYECLSYVDVTLVSMWFRILAMTSREIPMLAICVAAVRRKSCGVKRS